MSNTELLGIAIIGLAGRFSGSEDLTAFWQMLKHGQDAVVSFNDAELLAAGVDPTLLQHPNYVKAGTVIPDVEYFDADFFEMSARDAEITDPQHRLFMECAWQALEQAGYPPTTTNLCIGLYAGVGENNYQRHYLEPRMAELLASVGEYRLSILNSKDFIATRTAYKLNLTGPALTVQTACSTSLVAVHIACQSLLNFECDMALAGGVSIVLPQGQGYLYEPGMILSPDGFCRTFDAQAQGTSPGSGLGVVLLKRLADALADGDNIDAVILGSAINNDGADKIGYTAPSVKGQAAVILEAQAAADVHPEQISYIEAHGTGTPLGDPIELQALTQAFQANTQRTGYCAIASVKTNIGHTDTAAGIAGLIKTVLALKHRQLPPSLHFANPNPQINFTNSPFFVSDRLRDWEVEPNSQRCAGVSSFGIGGTNAHAIVAEAPIIEPSSPSRPVQLLTLSAKTDTALEIATRNLSDWLQHHTNPELSLPDVAYTLNRGRQSFAYRRMLVCADMSDAIEQLIQPEHLSTHQATEKTREVVFLFPGQGTQYANMTRVIYNTENIFKSIIDKCAELLIPHLGQDLRHLLYSDEEQNNAKLKQTAFTQPALFAVEYALANLWMSWGIQPKAMLGHSLGEYVAASLAGVFSLEDALALVTVRGKLMQSLPLGAMLAVPLSEAAIQQWLTPELSLAVVNGVERCVLSGTQEKITTLQQKLQTQGIDSRHLHTSHAFHSHLLEPVLASFTHKIQQVQLHPPTLPYLSNLTGTWISPEQATDPDYWVRHLRHTVRFGDNLQALFQQEADVFLEVGPGHTLSTLAQQHPDYSARFTVLQSLPRNRETEKNAETRQILATLGELWIRGVSVDWDGFYALEKRHRLPLPTYPFERKRYWLDRPQHIQPQQDYTNNSAAIASGGRNAIAQVSPSKQAKQPLSPLEQEVAQIWSKSLGIAVIEPNTDFFSVGGDSLLATQLIANLRKQFQISLDTHSLLQAPTLSQLAALIAAQLTPLEQKTVLPELVVKIQSGNPSWKPFILMHPVGGHVYFYRELARHLDPQPIYGIRARGVEGEAAPLKSMTDMAKVYTAALQEFQPQGPYYLGGASFGGTLAFAMAQELIAKGETVAFLALIDTPSPGNMPAALDDTADILFYLLKVEENANIDRNTLQALDEAQRLEFYLKHSQGAFSTPQELKIMLDLFQANLRAMREYNPPAYPGKLHFFLAGDRDEFNAQTPAHGWIGLAQQGIEIYTVPGNHITMNTEPYVQHLANYLQRYLHPKDLHRYL
ncbi:MAG: beta-ketoacyl synthase N-terminal-like domain-containing protein [Nostoc sp.]|uniref:beta-ketoacyl synthase N-terminal-like domain-containing protein n=1 Tax=Nostoc sp. TaxID=1180 RepID=UPI002FF1D100